jgi:hypothetical protein
MVKCSQVKYFSIPLMYTIHVSLKNSVKVRSVCVAVEGAKMAVVFG